jgi:hypothetical protein
MCIGIMDSTEPFDGPNLYMRSLVDDGRCVGCVNVVNHRGVGGAHARQYDKAQIQWTNMQLYRVSI